MWESGPFFTPLNPHTPPLPRTDSLFVKKTCLAMFISSFADYLVRPSPLLDDITVRLHVHDLVRPFSDKLVWSSYVYGLAGLYSLKLGTLWLCILLLNMSLCSPHPTHSFPHQANTPLGRCSS